MWSTASASRKSTKLPAGPDGARCSRRRLAIIDACECVLAALAIAAPCALVSWFGGGSGATLDPGTEEKAPRGTRRLWGRPSPGEKEAPWDIIGGMTDDRIAYQLAQRPAGPYVSLWITLRDATRGKSIRRNRSVCEASHSLAGGHSTRTRLARRGNRGPNHQRDQGSQDMIVCAVERSRISDVHTSI
jgi:hypothetical protein